MKHMRLAAAALLITLIASGCSTKEESTALPSAPTQGAAAETTQPPRQTATPDVTAAPSPTEEPDTLPEGMVRSYLTGEPVAEEIGRRRPAAVMINNIQACLPQWGISHAGVIYEAPVEGGISRMMAIFEDYDNLERIGSVRSCRNYFIFYAAGFEALYVHYGQSAYAVPYLELPEVNNISGLAGYGEQVFYRTDDRNPPHNAYTSGAGIAEGIDICGYSEEYPEDYQGYFQFAEAEEPVSLENGTNASLVLPGGYDYNSPSFVYDPDSGKYLRYQFGEPQIDEENGEQLAVTNILIQNSAWEYYESGGYLNIHTDDPGTGKYITGGKAVDITWKKTEPWGPTYYYDQEGNEITLNEGKTWICIVLDTYADQTHIE